jgi:hypothetical protein
MTSSNGFVLVVFSLFSLFVAVGIVWEGLAREKAGLIRFRLPLASMVRPPQRPTECTILLVLGMLLVIPAALFGRYPRELVAPLFWLWMLVENHQAVQS